MSEPIEQPQSDDELEHLAEAHFAVEARLAIQLGRESISSSTIAILELVKNAYDAGALRIRIRFKGLGTPEAKVVIEDDGSGMTATDLLDYWMVIGTTNKVKKRRAGTKRALTGEKGLGRLGLDRLSRYTNVQSIVEGATEGVQLPIDWALFEKEDVRLDQILLRVYPIPNLRQDPLTGEWNDYPHGTRLVLDELKDEWDQTTLADLRAELSLLVSPFSSEEDFQIELDSGQDWPTVDGVVTAPESLLKAAQWKVTASIGEDGAILMKMNSAHHNRVYEEGPQAWEKRFPAWGIVPHCGPLRFEFYFFPRRKTSLGDETISLGAIRNFLDANQGLRVYRDGFRVKPYGNPNGDGDWLRLAYRRMSSPQGVAQDDAPGNWRVGYNQVVGAVLLSRGENAELLDQTNREGLVEGKAFAHLRVFAEETVRFFELNHQEFEMSRELKPTPRDEAKEQADDALKDLAGAAATLAALNDQPENSPPSTDTPLKRPDHSALVSEVQKVLADAKEKLEHSAKTFRNEDKRESREKDTMANLASLGILAAAFGHETLGWANNCAVNAGWLERNLPQHFFFSDPEVEEQVKSKLTDTTTQARRIETFADFAIGNVRPEKRKRTTFCLKKVVQNVFKTFDQSLSAQRNIELDVEPYLPSEPCRIKGYPIDWESVLVNLITNAEWALRERKESYQRKIRVSLHAENDAFVLTFEDNGIGLPAGQEKRIFLPTVSNKRNEKGHVFGTGMGLTIVKNFVEQNTGGSISAVANGELGGAKFQIRVPAAPALNTES